MIRSLIDYVDGFAGSLADPAARGLLRAHASGAAPGGGMDARAALRSAIAYLLRAQAHGGDGGMGSYHLVRGWGAPYPETTGYAIPTLIAAGTLLSWDAPLEAAQKAAGWLLGLQRADGGWQGGRVGEGRPSVVFNTAQVVRGLLAAHDRWNDARFLEAAHRAGTWIASVQDADGAWRASNFMGMARVYDTYVDAPLLRLYGMTGEERFRAAAVRNLEWVLGRQEVNGWFADADNTRRHNDRPITHTIAYTIDGLLECSRLLDSDRYAQAALKAARLLCAHYLRDGRMHGRYNAGWVGSEHPLMTGCAQLAIVWYRAHELVGDDRYRQAHLRMLDQLVVIQGMGEAGPQEARGALPGSFPLWGRYEKFAFPNWGTKYLADALLCAQGHPPAY